MEGKRCRAHDALLALASPLAATLTPNRTRESSCALQKSSNDKLHVEFNPSGPPARTLARSRGLLHEIVTDVFASILFWRAVNGLSATMTGFIAVDV